MNFMDKIKGKEDDRLSFLKEYGFELTKDGYCNNYYSSERLYYNRVTVFIEGDYVRAENYQEFDIGGETGRFKAEATLDGLTKDKVLRLINEVLPSNLD